MSRGLMAFARESRRQFARGPRVASGVFVARRKFRWLSTKDEKDKRSIGFHAQVGFRLVG